MEHNSEKKVKYGFYGYLTERFPSQINVDVTNRCNLSCIHCPHSVEDYHKNNPVIYLDESLNKKMVDEVATYGKGCVQYIRYTADGEPLLHPKIYEMLLYAKENSGAVVTLTTNGTLLNEKNLDKLIKSNIDVIDISIDAHYKETYEKIRVGGSFEKVVNNVLNLLKRRGEFKDGIKIMVSFVEQEFNRQEKEKFIEFWTESGVDNVVIRPLHSVGGSVEEIAVQMNANSDESVRKPCIYPWERILLNSDGNLHYCPVSFGKNDIIADYRTNNIFKIWSGEMYNDLRKAHLKHSFENYPLCKGCPDWKNICWPGESGTNYSEIIDKLKKDEC
ncbi:radical SAM protein [Methanoplanus sp. FWC-SCC4]|uniref:Radical SAM protein n=1 Tax=Methanochimaera problematica TaxID=2609417 RepID=A0AA97F9M9_9EURY|nr:radical SAM protein [Methanoplanus sp. FWC-SCC4]WOF15385.1 radical SAM protein [Methanoplanus sp. FWC-SCC4]